MSTVLELLDSALEPRGASSTVVLRATLYLEHEFVVSALNELRRKLMLTQAGIDYLSDFDKLAVMFLMEAAGISKDDFSSRSIDIATL
jgi:hypothetical protein